MPSLVFRCLGGIAVVVLLHASSLADPGAPDPLELQAELTRRWSALDPRSAEARAIEREMRSLRRKTFRNPGEVTAENPGAFREALAALKTAPDGSTYAPNYKRDALLRARENPYKRAGALPWVMRGPGNVSGRSRAIVVDPRDATFNTWLVATVGGGIWKTTDGGSTWQDKTPELTTLSTTCLAMAASNPDILYAGTGMGYGRIVDLEGSGIWKSIDGGDSWTQLASTASGQILNAINRIVVDPSDPDVLVVCSNNPYSHLGVKGGFRVSGIFRSTDGGQSWTQTFDPDAELGATTDNRVQQIVADPSDFQRLYATVNEVGVVRSTDGGQSWTVSASNFALPFDVGNPPGGGLGLSGISVRTEMAIAPSDPNRLYAAVERPRGIADLYMSEDGGDSWVLVPDTGSDPNWFNAFGQSGQFSYTAGWFDNTIAVHPYDEDVVFVGGVNLYRIDIDPIADTRLATPIAWWIPNGNLPVVHADHHWLEPVPLGGGAFWLLNANDGGVAISKTQGASWTQITGLGTTQFYGADKAPGVDRYVGGMQDNGTWGSGLDPTSTSPWSFLLGGDGFEVAWHATDPNLMLYGSQFNGIVRSTDGGQTWTAVPEAQFPTVNGASGAPFITKIANDKTDPDLVFIVGSTGVRRSDDFGLSWTDHPVGSHWLGHRPFDNVEISIADPQVVWISSRLTNDPGTNAIGGIHVSTDGGMSFSEISINFPIGLFEASGIGTHPTDPGTAYFCFSLAGKEKLLKTDDYGASFQDLSAFAASKDFSSNGFPDVGVFSVLVMPYDDQILWVGTEIGLFISEDGGANWQFAEGTLPAVAIFQLRIVGEQVIAATQGRGIWSVTLPELAGYTPPEVTLAPRLHPLQMDPAGGLALDIDLRSPYDSTLVYVNDELFTTLPANPSPASEKIYVSVATQQTVYAHVRSYVDGREYATAERSGLAYPLTPITTFEWDVEDTSRLNEFLVNGFNAAFRPGFPTRALHTAHPYNPASESTLQLKAPIRVASENALLSYSDVCLVEKGAPGANHYTDPTFWDYVIVEATSDGSNWIPLIDGYDSRANPLWSSAYDLNPDGQGGSTTAGTADLYVPHVIDLHDSFDPGERVFIRFRLYSDPAVTAWGWAIDDLQIQPNGVSIGGNGEEPSEQTPAFVTALEANFPNPFNPRTSISFTVGERTRVRLGVYDLAGRLVKRLVDGDWHDPGSYDAVWMGVDDHGRAVASGVYLYRLRTDDFERSRKMVLVR